MSGGTPRGGGLVRLRHSQGYASGGEDLEDDASSRPPSQAFTIPRTRTWVDILENILWIGSAMLFIYYGDGNSNLVFLLCLDNRIRSIPLYIGILGVSLNVSYFLYSSMIAWGFKKYSEKWEVSSTAALPYITMLGLLSFCLFCFALWPIWSFLTLPLVFTLFMACMVVVPYLVFGTFKTQPELLRTD
ncbi:hypothetical protein Leryth_012533 [Lithospermum erythrorhizon]|uniref:Transmembrane protein 128 n=1 Tax=Lithospermum erythrorhizon TaxID=34254 RepID=A0AAV3PCZ1_LITER|nr:hypothetical protein Leryth_012533 [Lithospermum erythrorhizon]